jgi:hypothetical protein
VWRSHLCFSNLNSDMCFRGGVDTRVYISLSRRKVWDGCNMLNKIVSAYLKWYLSCLSDNPYTFCMKLAQQHHRIYLKIRMKVYAITLITQNTLLWVHWVLHEYTRTSFQRKLNHRWQIGDI